MGKKKDCFGQEDYVCMTPNCPYAKECIQVVWEQRLNRALNRNAPKQQKIRRRSPSRVSVES